MTKRQLLERVKEILGAYFTRSGADLAGYFVLR
jgi:hypothetical protein